MSHLPVLKKQVLEYLKVEENKNFLDATAGEGGHTRLILENNGPGGKVIAVERDPVLFQKLKDRDLGKRVVLINESYSNIKDVKNIDGVLLDLGLSSWHLEESGRGFSFLKDEPLDMRFNPEKNPLTAYKIVNEWPEKEIGRILKEYGEERFSERIAKRIVEEKVIKTASDLRETIEKAVPFKSRIHPATRTFQALRIAVNKELEHLEKALPQLFEILSPKGRLVVISFHSLEDRIAKQFFKSQKGLKIITKKPIKASLEEIRDNPRARSSKLRAAEKI